MPPTVVVVQAARQRHHRDPAELGHRAYLRTKSPHGGSPTTPPALKPSYLHRLGTATLVVRPVSTIAFTDRSPVTPGSTTVYSPAGTE
jgi:hypothetical protein